MRFQKKKEEGKGGVDRMVFFLGINLDSRIIDNEENNYIERKEDTGDGIRSVLAGRKKRKTPQTIKYIS